MQLNFSLLCFCILLTQATKGIYGQCSTPPKNQAVYEGTRNITVTCNSPSYVSYSITPTIDELMNHLITNYSDDVTASLKNLYSVNSTDLVIRLAQAAAPIPITTAGEYIVRYPDSTKVLFKLVVVTGRGPTCCSSANSTHIQMNCNVTYADSSFDPINAKLTWVSDGMVYSSVVPPRKIVANNYVGSLSSITVNASDQSKFICRVSFTKPTNVGPYAIAMNAPEFFSSCVVQCPCIMPLKNIVAYEGDTNIQVYYPASPRAVQWTVTATTDEITLVHNIVNYTDAVDASYAADYAFGASVLTIRNATTTVEPRHNISTAGLYGLQCGNNQVISFKLLVIRQGPMCSKAISQDSTNVQVSCSVIYADCIAYPMNAVFTFYVDGQPTSTDTPQRNTNDAFTYISTSTFSSTYKASSDYQCVLAFGKPTGVQYNEVTMNNLAFSRNCTA